MRLMMKRALSLLLCLCLFTPALSLAEKDAAGVRFTLSAQLDPDAWPQEQRKLLRGIADLLDVAEVAGTLETSFTECFDLKTEFLLDGAEETRTTLRIFGSERHWGVQSSLFGEQTMMLNMAAMLEFSMKAYFHLNIPLQRVALFLTPFVHINAFETLYTPWQDVLLAQDGPRVIPAEKMRLLAQQLSAIAADDRAFTFWTRALALEAGYDETIQTTMTMLPEWLESFLDADGLVVTMKDGLETWRTGSTTLFTRTEDGAAWTLTLPATPDGYVLTASFTKHEGNLNLHLRIEDTYAESTLLDAAVIGTNLPETLPIAKPFTLSVELSGDAAGSGTHLRFEGENAGEAVTVRMVDPATGAAMLTLNGTLSPYEPAVVPDFGLQNMDGVNLLSVNDATLSALMKDIARPLMDGMLPLLVHIPASTLQSLLDLLTDSGLLDMLSTDHTSEEEELDSYDGGDYDDEYAWDEDSEDDYASADDDYAAADDGELAWDEDIEDEYAAADDGELAEYEDE